MEGYASLWEVELMETLYSLPPLAVKTVLVRFPLGSGINGNENREQLL